MFVKVKNKLGQEVIINTKYISTINVAKKVVHMVGIDYGFELKIGDGFGKLLEAIENEK